MINLFSEHVYGTEEGIGIGENGKMNRQQKTHKSNRYVGLRFLLQKYNNSHYYTFYSTAQEFM